jgi:hypothetical protein
MFSHEDPSSEGVPMDCKEPTISPSLPTKRPNRMSVNKILWEERQYYMKINSKTTSHMHICFVHCELLQYCKHTKVFKTPNVRCNNFVRDPC